MKTEYGRSLLEMVGVLAISGILAAAAFRTFQVIQTRQHRAIAEDQLRELANNAKILFSGRQSFSGISTNYLIKAGAIKHDRFRLGGPFTAMALPNTRDGIRSFEITVPDLSNSDCLYFATKRFDFVHSVKVNGFEQTPTSYCQPGTTNELTFIIR